MHKILFFLLFCCSINAQDTARVSLTDGYELLQWAEKGYILEKVDSINNVYMLYLRQVNDELEGANELLELIVKNDTKLIDRLNNYIAFLQGEVSFSKEEIKEMKQELKQYKKARNEARAASIVTIVIASLITFLAL